MHWLLWEWSEIQQQRCLAHAGLEQPSVINGYHFPQWEGKAIARLNGGQSSLLKDLKDQIFQKQSRHKIESYLWWNHLSPSFSMSDLVTYLRTVLYSVSFLFTRTLLWFRPVSNLHCCKSILGFSLPNCQTFYRENPSKKPHKSFRKKRICSNFLPGDPLCLMGKASISDLHTQSH